MRCKARSTREEFANPLFTTDLPRTVSSYCTSAWHLACTLLPRIANATPLLRIDLEMINMASNYVRMRRLSGLFVACAMSFSACHARPVLNTGTNSAPSVGGTIAGIVTTADATVAVPSRKVTATETTTGSRHEASTASNGGYTIQVPEGNYRIEVELRAVEVIAKQPDPTRVTNGDLDTGRDFVIAVKPPGSAAS